MIIRLRGSCIFLFFLDRSGGINYKISRFTRTTAQDCFSEFKASFHNRQPRVWQGWKCPPAYFNLINLSEAVITGPHAIAGMMRRNSSPTKTTAFRLSLFISFPGLNRWFIRQKQASVSMLAERRLWSCHHDPWTLAWWFARTRYPKKGKGVAHSQIKLFP